MQQENINSADAQTENTVYTLNIDGTNEDYSIEQIEDLVKKGINYQLVCGDYERMQKMAFAEGRSVSEYISRIEEKRRAERREEITQKYGDSELADYILNLEAAANPQRDDIGFDELKEFFPDITDLSELPASVVSAAKLRGSRILDEWLRYRYINQSRQKAQRAKQKSGIDSSIGSQREQITADYDPAKLQFIKGIWGK